MKNLRGNFFRAMIVPGTEEPEFCETLWTGKGVRVERILSSGQSTPPGAWYDQEEDEWVMLLQGWAVLEYEDGSRERMGPGDWLMIPARCRHRVAFTSKDPCCVWFAVFASLTANDVGECRA